METNRQKKIGNLLQKDLVDILQGEIRKNNIHNLIISVSKVSVTTDLSIAKVFLSVFPQEKAVEIFFSDESHFSNQPYVSRGWFKRGEKKSSTLLKID